MRTEKIMWKKTNDGYEGQLPNALRYMIVGFGSRQWLYRLTDSGQMESIVDAPDVRHLKRYAQEWHDQAAAKGFRRVVGGNFALAINGRDSGAHLLG